MGLQLLSKCYSEFLMKVIIILEFGKGLLDSIEPVEKGLYQGIYCLHK